MFLSLEMFLVFQIDRGNLHTERHTQRDTQRDTERDTERDTQRQTRRDTERHTQRQKDTETERVRERVRETERERDRVACSYNEGLVFEQGTSDIGKQDFGTRKLGTLFFILTFSTNSRRFVGSRKGRCT